MEIQCNAAMEELNKECGKICIIEQRSTEESSNKF